MKIETTKPTSGVRLIFSDMPERVYVEDKLWIATNYDKLQIGIVGGKRYELVKGRLVEIVVEKVGAS